MAATARTAGGTMVLDPDRRYLVGRAADADIRLEDPRVSRRHATIELVGGEWIVTDLDSRRGTYVDGRAITQPATISGSVVVTLAAPDGPRIDLAPSDAPVGRAPLLRRLRGRRGASAAVVFLLVVPVLAVVWWLVPCCASPPPIEDQLVVVEVTAPGSRTEVGLAALTGTDGDLLVVPVTPTTVAERAAFRVAIGLEDRRFDVSAVPVETGDSLIVLRLVGLEALPALRDHVDQLGGAGMRTSSRGAATTWVFADATGAAGLVATGSFVAETTLVGRTGLDVEGGSPVPDFAPLTDGRSVAGFVTSPCVEDAEVAVVIVEAADGPSLVDAAESADRLVGPAPIERFSAPLPAPTPICDR